MDILLYYFEAIVKFEYLHLFLLTMILFLIYHLLKFLPILLLSNKPKNISWGFIARHKIISMQKR